MTSLDNSLRIWFPKTRSDIEADWGGPHRPFFYNRRVYKVFILLYCMSYGNKKDQALYSKLYFKAMGILRDLHLIEFQKIFKKLKGGRE